MIKAYNHLYFGFYRMLLRTTDSDIAEYSAVFFLSGCFAIDIFMLSLPFTSGVWRHIPVKTGAISISILIGIINYFYFVGSGKYLKLIEEHKNASPERLRRLDRIAIAFCFLSILSPILFGIIKHFVP